MAMLNNRDEPTPLKDAVKDDDPQALEEHGAFEIQSVGRLRDLIKKATHTESPGALRALCDYAVEDFEPELGGMKTDYHFGKILEAYVARSSRIRNHEGETINVLLDYQPNLSTITIAGLIGQGFHEELQSVLADYETDDIINNLNDDYEHRDRPSAFEAVMLKTILRGTGYKKGDEQDFFDAIQNLIDENCPAVIEKAHEIGGLGDKQIMRYAVALSPDEATTRRAHELTDTPLVIEEEYDYGGGTYQAEHLEDEFLEAMRRGHDGGVQLYMNEIEPPLEQQEFHNALSAAPNLDGTDDEYENYHTDTVNEETAHRLLEHYGTFSSESTFTTIVQDYSADFIKRAIEQYEGGNIRKQGLRHADIDKITYVARNAPMNQPHYCLEQHLKDLEGDVDEAYSAFIEACSPEEERELIAEAAEKGYMTVLRHADQFIDMDQTIDEADYVTTVGHSEESDRYVADASETTLARFAFARAIGMGHTDVFDEHYPDWGTIDDLSDRAVSDLASNYGVDDVAEKLDERGHDEPLQQLRDRLGSTAIDESLSGRRQNWKKARRLLEHDFNLPDDADIAYRAFRDDKREFFDLFLEKGDPINAKIFYEAALNKSEDDLRLVKKHYTPGQDTLIRAVNKIVTQRKSDLRFEEKIKRIERLDALFDLDLDHKPTRGSNELSYRPLRTVLGFDGRPDDQKRSNKRKSGNNRRYNNTPGLSSDWCELFVKMGAETDRPNLMEEALKYGQKEHVEFLIEHGFESENEIDGSVLTHREADDEAVLAFFQGTDHKKRNNNKSIREALTEIIDMQSGERAEQLRALLRGDIDLESKRSAEVRDALIESIAEGTNNWAISAVFLNELMREQPSSIPPPPESLVRDVEDTPVYDIITDHLRPRQVNRLEMGKVDLTNQSS